MKKTTLILTLLTILIILLFPFLGNSFMQKLIDENIQVLQSQGLVLKKSTKETGYLNTKQHFEFVLQDTQALQNYLRFYTKSTVPPAVEKVFQGATIGADVAYSNIPFSKAVTVEVYPLQLANTLMQEMKKNNPQAYRYFSDFLDAKGLLYHVEYNVLSNDFNGFVKDIDAHYSVKKNANVRMQLEGARFSGEGNIFAAQKLTFHIQTMKLALEDAANALSFEINNLQNRSEFASFSHYTTDTEVFQIRFLMKNSQDDINISLDNVDMASSASEKDDKVALHSKSFIDTLVFHTNKLDFSLKALHSDIAIEGLDKQSYEKFSQLLAQSKQIRQQALLGMLAHGLHVKVSDLSFENITLNSIEELGSMKIQSDLKIAQDKDFAKKLKMSPLLLLANVQIDMKISLAKALYLKMIEDTPAAAVIVSYAKEDAQSVYFDIVFKESRLTVNGKVVQ
ncbi:YdgA family protein [Sulfurimonas sp. SWIR-19]|uniref:YdgA family protein n=1 Tax=Sulfurimonas sp. SWIR-19 TaxID=2878390 RepID=UPI001CF519D9|nr:YdgA family protein [Sulfurimonas sp. SWIR-19]UCN00039.1 YdgA family protein [Sulfurimonas sp. SWIR-19]